MEAKDTLKFSVTLIPLLLKYEKTISFGGKRGLGGIWADIRSGKWFRK